MQLALNPSETALWHTLVCDAESLAKTTLNEEMESYLVFMLMRFMQDAQLSGRVIALDYLQSFHAHGQAQREQLQEVGDSCLILSGLFPHRAERRQVRISYFVGLGRSAYFNIAEQLENSLGKMFAELSSNFVQMMDVLQAVHQIGHNEPLLEPLQSLELWQETGSRHAYRQFQSSTGTPPNKHLDTNQH